MSSRGPDDGADQLGRAYEQAWSEWADSGEAARWEAVVGDGLVAGDEGEA